MGMMAHFLPKPLRQLLERKQFDYRVEVLIFSVGCAETRFDAPVLDADSAVALLTDLSLHAMGLTEADFEDMTVVIRIERINKGAADGEA